MSDLTIEDIKAKIVQVDKDMDELRKQGDASRRLQILGEYKEYLQEELEFLKREKRI